MGTVLRPIGVALLFALCGALSAPLAGEGWLFRPIWRWQLRYGFAVWQMAVGTYLYLVRCEAEKRTISG